MHVLIRNRDWLTQIVCAHRMSLMFTTYNWGCKFARFEATINAKSICVSCARRNYTSPFKKWTHETVWSDTESVATLFLSHMSDMFDEAKKDGRPVLPWFRFSFEGHWSLIFQRSVKTFFYAIKRPGAVCNMIIHLNRFIPQFHAFVMSHRIWTSG